MFAAAFSDEAYHGAIELCSRFPLLVIINSPMSPRLSEKMLLQHVMTVNNKREKEEEK